MSTPPPRPPRENLLLSLVCNIAVPTLILTRLSRPERLGPELALVLALLFPLGYGIYDFTQRRKTSWIAILGLVSVALTGGLGLLKANLWWFAIKEAAVPLVIGAGVLLSMGTKRPLVREMLYNEQVIDVAKVDAALAARDSRPAFDALLRSSSYLLAFTFLVSAALNFALARHFLKSPTGSPEFNEELGVMNAWSWPVIVIPSMVMTGFALWRLFAGITRLTGLKAEEIMHGTEEKPAAEPPR